MWSLVLKVLATLVGVLIWYVRRSQRKLSELKNKTVLISGVSRDNIGSAFATIAAHNDASCIVLLCFKAEGVQELAAELPCTNVKVIEVDLTEDKALTALSAQLPSQIDVVVLLHVVSTYMDTSNVQLPAQLTRLFQVNVVSYLQLLNLLSPKFSPSPRICVASSVAGVVPMPSRAAYCVSKAALTSLMQCWGLEHPTHQMLLFFPGMIDTPIVASEYERDTIQKNAISPYDLATAVLTSPGYLLYYPFTGYLAHLLNVFFPSQVRQHIHRVLPPVKPAM
jgi:NAD(P)-dependent dehydrogenase (short-subunit alcohol dehydrogenase family)